MSAALDWNNGSQGAFVMSLFQDQSGDVWAATEDKGVWRYSTADKKWTNYSVKEGLGDDTVYALAQDRKGRIWAGTLRNGVSVWNGQRWQNYGLLDGPLGERVFAIATCPVDGDVWIATNAGLTRYSLKNDTWNYYTRAEGLPSDQIQALAFDSVGDLYAGTQCDGLAIAKATEDYKNWRLEPGSEKMPLTVAGKGLPSSQVNDILVADDDTVYVATPNGLSRSKDFGEHWNYLRGINWDDKVKNQRSKPQPEQPKENLNTELLREDYVTNLGEDAQGLLYIGYRLKGYEIRRPLTDRVPFISAKDEHDQFPYISTVLPLRDGSTLLATYGNGLTQAEKSPAFAPNEDEKKMMAERRNWKQFDLPAGVPALPAPAKASTAVELSVLLQRVNAPGTAMKPGEALYEGEDWRTWGDWVGRYGSRYAMLCASSAPFDLAVINDFSYRVEGSMGPSFPTNSLRRWIHWKQTDIPRVLYVPQLGYRREAEWDDNAETMPMTIEGPDVWAKVTVPGGTHRLSTYFFNKDGHDGNNRMRDYLLEVKKGEANDVSEADKLPTQAKTRVRDFWGGVYKSFAVQGPGTFWLKVGKNNSFNTILCGVFLDKLDGPPTKFENHRDIWSGKLAYETPIVSKTPLSQPNAGDDVAVGATALVKALDDRRAQHGTLPLQWADRVLAFRALGGVGWGNYKATATMRERGANPETQAILQRWRWQTAIWTDDDRNQWQNAMIAAWEGVVRRNPALQDAKF